MSEPDTIRHRDAPGAEQNVPNAERDVPERGPTTDADPARRRQDGDAPGDPPGGHAGDPDPDGGVSTLFIRRPITTLMLMAGVLIVGVIAYFALPIASLPTVDVATILVTAQLSGADPQTNAYAVTNPLETQFGQIPGLTTMTSASANSYAQITLQFGFNRTVEGAAQDVQAAINAATASLPLAMAQPPVYRKTNPADTPVLILALTSDTLPLTTVDDWGENILMQRISQVKGVGLVTIGGQQQPAMRLEMDPAKLAEIGLTIEDVRTAVLQASTITSKGVLQGQQKAIALEANDQLLDKNDYDRIIIAYRNGAPVLVREMGHAEIGAANELLAGWYNGKRAVILNVLLANGANAIKTVDAIKKELPRLEASLPPAMTVSVVSDRTTTIRASVSDVENTLLLTIGLVVLTIFVFLRNVWATVIPAFSMVLSIIGTFAVMHVLGYSLDNLSLMALSISVGFVVDDAIVMIENIARHLEQGMPPLQAALKGAGEIGFTILSISVSLIAVFIPLFLMAGVVGKMLQEFAVTVSVAILVSVFVSLTLTPTLCALLLKPENRDERHGRLYEMAERAFDWLLARYDHALNFVLRHQFATLLVMLGTIMLTGVLFVIIPKGFFPQQDTGLITGITEAAQDISTAGMGRRQQEIAAIVARDAAVASVASYIGPGPSNAAPNQGRMFITLKPLSKRGPNGGAQQVIDRLAEPLRQVQGMHLFMQAAQDLTIGARTSKAQYQFTLVDTNPQELTGYASKMVEQLAKADGVADVSSDQESSGPLLMLDIDRAAAARFGLQPQAIDEGLYDAFGSRMATRVYGVQGQYFVIVEADPAFRTGAGALDQVYLRSPAGAMVRLSQVAKITPQVAPVVINHQNQAPSVTISFNLKPGVSIGAAVSSVQTIEASLHLPLTVQASFQGSAQAYQIALAGQATLIGAAVVAIYLILGMLYESWIHPVTIISTLPSAGLGALLALMAAGMPLDVIGIIGILLLLGIVKKNGIMLVDFAMAEEASGKSAEEAIHNACTLRFRPILMTTLCAILAGVPLMLGGGIGAQLRQPLGFAIVGGLLLSQLLTLFTTPVIYIYMDRLGGVITSLGHAGRTTRKSAE
jgi:hydrophobe/amphiphile efflux-1 (HAE1) family protein